MRKPSINGPQHLKQNDKEDTEADTKYWYVVSGRVEEDDGRAKYCPTPILMTSLCGRTSAGSAGASEVKWMLKGGRRREIVARNASDNRPGRGTAARGWTGRSVCSPPAGVQPPSRRQIIGEGAWREAGSAPPLKSICKGPG